MFTDQEPPDNKAPNIRFSIATFEEHKTRVCNATGVDPGPVGPYRLCDMRPSFGFVYADEIDGYANYGHRDLDLIFGDIRHFYTDEVLEKYEVLSSALRSCAA